MALTKEQMRNRILQKIGILASGETASSEDADLVETAIDDLNEHLVARGLSTWETSAIPQEVAIAFRDWCAATVMDQFDVPADMQAKITADRTIAERDMKMVVRADDPGAPIVGSYF